MVEQEAVLTSVLMIFAPRNWIPEYADRPENIFATSGILDTSLLHHIERAKANGVTQEEMAEVLTQPAFYAGWPKAWAALRMAKEVYHNIAEEESK